MNKILISLFLSVVMVACSSTQVPPNAPDNEKLTAIHTMYADYKDAFPKVQDITAAELKALMDEDKTPIIVDVREPKEQAVSMIPGAKTQEEFEAFRRTARLGKDTLIVTHCTIGYRSGKYAEQLQEEGFEGVRNLKGSLLAWTHVGGALVDSKGNPTKKLHTYGKQWELTADAYEGKY